MINSVDEIPILLKDAKFKMSEMLVSWKYLINTDFGLEKSILFQCIDCIKLELSYQVFLQTIRFKA